MPNAGLLLLDVDGPLNPYDAPPHRRPPGYDTYRRTPDGRWFTGKDIRRHKGMRVWLNPDHGATLLALAVETGLQLTWCTTWLEEANTLIGPSIGLPTLPVIPFPAADLAPAGPNAYQWTRDGSWKWAGVTAYCAGIPIAWLDDEHSTRWYATARARFDRARADTPTLLCHTDPRTGILPTHLADIRAWATDLPGRDHR